MGIAKQLNELAQERVKIQSETMVDSQFGQQQW